jgi:short subunit dehydrogenase-like uncharacterized protein
MSNCEWILYGATGYTGRCIAEEAVRRGLRPILAGRNADQVQVLARQFGIDHRVFGLNEPSRLKESIRGAYLILNCAGPFSATARPLMAACLAEHVHYLDITGEIDVIEAAAALDPEAKVADVTLLPAVGFDVVPSDCLAGKLVEKLPSATQLQLAITSAGSVSPGTAKTMLEATWEGGRVRIDGRLQRVPLAWKTREVPFREGPHLAMTIPWGDVASAYYSTGIGNIEVYAAGSARQFAALRRWRWLLPAVGVWPLRTLAKWLIERRLPGPSAASRDRETASLWGRVEDSHGARVEGTLTTPNGYSLTVMTALAAVERLLTTPLSSGFLTPALAFGPDFIGTFPGCDFRFTTA